MRGSVILSCHGTRNPRAAIPFSAIEPQLVPRGCGSLEFSSPEENINSAREEDLHES